MVRTTRHAGWLIAALAVLRGFPAAHAPAAEPRSNQTFSIVAQSTTATARTGRRPLRDRIAASNLPLRAPAAKPAPAEDAPEPPVPDELPVAPEHVPTDSAEEQSVAATPPDVVEHAPAPDVVENASPAAATTAPDGAESDPRPDAVENEPLAASVEPTEPIEPIEPVEHAEPIAAEAAVVTLPTSVAEDADVQTVAAEARAADEAEPPLEETAANATPVPAPESPPHPRPSDAVRRKLLNRIKGAFATRPRAGVGAASPSVTAPGSPDPASPDSPQPAPADATAAAPASEATVAPARLEFDVRESRSLVGEGEQIVMRIAVRNVGGATAERVTTTLFFADGIEPVQAIGHTAEVYPGEVRFATVPELSPGSSVDLLVTAVGTRPGSVAYRGELACDQLAGLIAREGAVTVQPRRAPLP